MNDEIQRHALSFGGVADAYDRARPSYPPEAGRWLIGTGELNVLELGAGTGKLTELLVAQGHRVVATDPLPEMLARLRERVTPFAVGVSGAEAIPAPSRSVDVVVCAQSFHWFDHDRALPEIARVLRPGGHLALVWNQRDESIPWVKRLGRLIDTEGRGTDLAGPMRSSPYFGEVEETSFRWWQDLKRDGLLDLVRSRSAIATLGDDARERRLAEVGALYDEYGRGPEGMRLPYLTYCYRAQVVHPPQVEEPEPADDATDQTTDKTAEGRDRGAASGPASAEPRDKPAQPPGPPEDPGTLLIDFR